MKRGKRSVLHFHLRKRASCGQGRARYPDTVNTFSTTRYLITSTATCSLMTPLPVCLTGLEHIASNEIDLYTVSAEVLEIWTQPSLVWICRFIALLLKWKLYFCCILPAKRDEVGIGWWLLAQHWGFCVSFDWLDFDSVSEEESHPSDNTTVHLLCWHLLSKASITTIFRTIFQALSTSLNWNFT